MNSAVKALIPRIDLPKYFYLSSLPDPPKGTLVSLNLTVEGNLQSFTTHVGNAQPSMLDVLDAFPEVNVKNGLARTALKTVKLPNEWVLECGPCKGKTGFHLTFDTPGGQHWEKDFEVDTLKLVELLELVEWVRNLPKGG